MKSTIVSQLDLFKYNTFKEIAFGIGKEVTQLAKDHYKQQELADEANAQLEATRNDQFDKAVAALESDILSSKKGAKTKFKQIKKTFEESRTLHT